MASRSGGPNSVHNNALICGIVLRMFLTRAERALIISPTGSPMQNPIALAMIAAYLAGTTLVGILMLRRSRGGDDWAVAGGRMGVLMIAVGIAGTRVGGAATYGVAGDVITSGVWSMWYAVNTFLALALVGIFYAVPYRRLGIQTVGEVFLQRWGSRRCQWLTSLCVQTEYLIVNIIEP